MFSKDNKMNYLGDLSLKTICHIKNTHSSTAVGKVKTIRFMINEDETFTKSKLDLFYPTRKCDSL